jgi:hypothetical protein
MQSTKASTLTIMLKLKQAMAAQRKNFIINVGIVDVVGVVVIFVKRRGLDLSSSLMVLMATTRTVEDIITGMLYGRTRLMFAMRRRIRRDDEGRG